jgi:hypothetical protein
MKKLQKRVEEILHKKYDWPIAPLNQLGQEIIKATKQALKEKKKKHKIDFQYEKNSI